MLSTRQEWKYSPVVYLHSVLSSNLTKVLLDDVGIGSNIERVRVATRSPILLPLCLKTSVQTASGTGGSGRRRRVGRGRVGRRWRVGCCSTALALIVPVVNLDTAETRVACRAACMDKLVKLRMPIESTHEISTHQCS